MSRLRKVEEVTCRWDSLLEEDLETKPNRWLALCKLFCVVYDEQLGSLGRNNGQICMQSTP